MRVQIALIIISYIVNGLAVTWPHDSTFDVMINVTPQYVTYKYLNSIDSIVGIDSIKIDNKFRDVVKHQYNLVRNGERKYAFEKGIYIEFDSSLTYNEFLKSLLGTAQLFSDYNQTLRIGNVDVITNFYGYRIRDCYWESRPAIIVENNKIVLWTIRSGKIEITNNLDSKKFDSLLRTNIDTCFDAKSLAYAKMIHNEKCLRISSLPDEKIGRIASVFQNILFKSEFVFKFYLIDNKILARTINVDSLCLKNGN